MRVIIKTANYFVSILRKSITDSISYLRFQDFPHHLWQTSMWYSSDTYLVLINISHGRPNITRLSLLIKSLFISASPCEQDCVVTIKFYNLEFSTSSEQTSFYPSAQDTSLFFHCFFFFFLFFLFQEFHVIPLVRIVDTFVE